MTSRLKPAPDHPGWQEWLVGRPEQFNVAVLGRMIMRQEGERTVRVRLIDPAERLANASGMVHGGALMAFIDTAMFAGALQVIGTPDAGGVTVDCQTQFLSPGTIGKPLDAEVELVRETRRMLFVRGLLVQEEATVCSFTGLIRKAS